jgi:hypothetical protein
LANLWNTFQIIKKIIIIITNGCSKIARIGHNLLWCKKRKERENFKVAENQVGRPLSEKKKETRKLGQFLQWNGKERKIWDTIMPFRLRLERTQKINCFQKGNEKKDTRHAVHCSQKRRRGKSNIPKERKFLSNNKIRESMLVPEKRKKKIRQRMMKGVGLARLYHGWRRKGYKKKYKNKESPS